MSLTLGGATPPPPPPVPEETKVPDAIRRAAEAAGVPIPELTPDQVLQQHQANPQDRASLEQVEKILDSLLPDADRVSWTDRWGRTHSSPLYATIRQQRRLMGLIKLILSKISDNPGKVGMADLIDYLTSESGIDDVLEVFAMLHEEGILEARKQADDSSVAVEDMVSIEEVYRAVVPFCVAPLKSLARTFAPALQESGLLG